MTETDLKTLAASGFSFKKSLGQNFITDTNLLRAICADAEITGDDCVLEVGVGAATLTRCLAERAKSVIGYEIDKRLATVIDAATGELRNVSVVYADVLREPMSRIEELCGGGFKVVANLPYYITTPILMKFVEESERVDSITVMVQEEVAERLCADAGDDDYGGISAIIRYVGTPKLTRKVPRQVFTPVPNVDSAVVHIKIEPHDRAFFGFFRKTVHAAFAMRRKTLVNNLSAAFGLTKPAAAAVIVECGYDERIRGEEIGCEGFKTLAARLKQIT